MIMKNKTTQKPMKSTLHRLFQVLLQQKAKLMLIFLAAIVSSITFALMPIYSGRAIDGLIHGIKTYDGSAKLFDVLMQNIGRPVLLLAILGIASAVFAFIQQWIVASVGENLTLTLRKKINEKITKLPMRYFDTHPVGDILSRSTNDLEKVSEFMQKDLAQLIYAVLSVVMAVLIMLLLDPFLTLIALISVAIAVIGTFLISKKTQQYYQKNQEIVAQINAKTEEFYRGNSIIKVFNYQQKAVDIITESNEKQYAAGKKAEFINFSVYPTIRFINQLGLIMTAVAGGILAIQGRITIGIIQAFLQYVSQISEPVSTFSYVINSLQSALAGAKRVFNFLDEEEEIPDNQPLQLAACKEGRVKFEHVQFGYSPDKILMKDISFEVKPSEMVAIVGPTGGGKTTLINLLMRFYEINGGKITIDGVDIRELPRYELRRLIGMVLQDTWLFEGTIAENIAYGKPDATMEEIVEAAKSACCHHFIQTLPQGYHTVLSSDAAHISQGQMQLLTIARVMLANPLIMILDEATSSVDTRTEVDIQKAMYTIMKGKTSFVIAHRLSTIKNADLILVVKDGDIIETGTHQSLLRQNGFYASLYNSQF